jgi:hypothetical protein
MPRGRTGFALALIALAWASGIAGVPGASAQPLPVPETEHSGPLPARPEPPVDENAGAEEFLHAARSAIARGHIAEAQEELERAQTRLLDRSVPLFKTRDTSTHPAIPLIAQASKALAAGDRAAAMQYVAQALPLAVPPKE